MRARAAFYTGNKRFAIERIEVPEPGPGEVQIEVAYCGICGTDMHVYHGHMDKRVGPRRVIGHEMSGMISALGAGGASVEGFEPGQPVVVRPLDPCGSCPACRRGHSHICHHLRFIGLDSDGAFQERWNVPAHTLHALPEGLALEHAALIEPVAVACHAVRLARTAPGEDALVIGGGPIGLLVAMVARHAGAIVSIAEVNASRLAFAGDLGFQAFSPAEQPVTAWAETATAGKGADLVFEVSGSQAGAEAMTAAAATRGRVVMVAIHPERRSVDLFRFFWRELEMIGTRVYEPQDYDTAINLVATGAIPATSLVTEVRDLSEIGQAFADLDGDTSSIKTLIRCSGEA